MAKIKEKYFDKEAILEMAEQYGVSDNALFLQTLKNYETIQRSIEGIDQIVSQNDDLTISKEYVKGRENLYLHPAIKELPKQIDASNKTLDKMLDIIEKLGTPKISDPFVEFCNN
jgi:hypothetical protein